MTAHTDSGELQRICPMPSSHSLPYSPPVYTGMPSSVPWHQVLWSLMAADAVQLWFMPLRRNVPCQVDYTSSVLLVKWVA